MITKTENTYLLVEIWLAASLSAHDFVPAEFWRSQYENMRDIYLKSTDNYIYSDIENNVCGFISISENCRIESLFVLPQYQGKGYGSRLLDLAKSKCKELSLSVFCENYLAVDFYLKNGFRIAFKSVDRYTGCEEYCMVYSS